MIKEIFKHIWSHRLYRNQLIIVGVTILIGLICYGSIGKDFTKQWEDWINIVLTILTLSVALMLWINERIMSWQNELPKKLNVSYQFQDKLFATIENAPLTGVDDIRQWAISLAGTVLNNGKKVEFGGFKIFPARRIAKKMQYEIWIYLSEKIDDGKAGQVYRFDDEGKLIQIAG